MTNILLILRAVSIQNSLSNTMNPLIGQIKTLRIALLKMVEELTTEQLNEIPAGFNNNIIWNIGHLLSSQQGLCYMRSGLPITIEEKYFLDYKVDSKPEQFVDAAGIATIKELLLTAIDRFDEDYHKNIFTGYHAWTNRYGITLTTIDEAISFIFFHEGLHFGYVMALKRIVNRK